MRRVNIWMRAAGGTAVLALALAGTAGCQGSTSTGAPAARRSPGTGTLAEATGEPSPGASPVLADGRSAAYLTGLDTTHNTVTFDLIEFLTGDAAKAQWKKEHPE